MSLDEIKQKYVEKHLARICEPSEDYIKDQIRHQLDRVFDIGYNLGKDSGWAFEQDNLRNQRTDEE